MIPVPNYTPRSPGYHKAIIIPTRPRTPAAAAPETGVGAAARALDEALLIRLLAPPTPAVATLEAPLTATLPTLDPPLTATLNTDVIPPITSVVKDE
jgi:hypothetical protein